MGRTTRGSRTPEGASEGCPRASASAEGEPATVGSRGFALPPDAEGEPRGVRDAGGGLKRKAQEPRRERLVIGRGAGQPEHAAVRDVLSEHHATGVLAH